jgi:molybdopterin-binding protein
VQRDTLVAVVEIHAGPHRLVSMMTREAIDEMGLQEGDLATAVVKSTNVIVEVPPAP